MLCCPWSTKTTGSSSSTSLPDSCPYRDTVSTQPTRWRRTRAPRDGLGAAAPRPSGLLRWRAAATPAHRLDLDTSGLLVVARDPATLRALQRQFAREEVRKRYVAVVDGDVAGDRGCIELALRPDRHERPRQVHDPVHGKPARTTWEVIERAADRTRVALYPHTGRTHQLRVHAAHPAGLGAPIRGDRLYGTGGERLLLHAQRISFRHPASGRLIELTSSPPF